MGKKSNTNYVLTRDNRLVHRVVYEEAYGPIPKGWVVHHINEQKRDNRLENLIALPSVLHDTLHKIQRKERVRFTRYQLQVILNTRGAAIRELSDEITNLRTRLRQLQAQLDAVGLDDLYKCVDKAAPREPVIRHTEHKVDPKPFRPETRLRRVQS